MSDKHYLVSALRNVMGALTELENIYPLENESKVCFREQLANAEQDLNQAMRSEMPDESESKIQDVPDMTRGQAPMPPAKGLDHNDPLYHAMLDFVESGLNLHHFFAIVELAAKCISLMGAIDVARYLAEVDDEPDYVLRQSDVVEMSRLLNRHISKYYR